VAAEVSLTGAFWILASAELAAGVPLLYRLARGPSVCDRVLATNVLSTQCALAVLLAAAALHRTVYLDVALWLVSFSYLGAILWSRYLERGLL
jgi:multicomponent Na+:H+ antiporter subunit F